MWSGSTRVRDMCELLLGEKKCRLQTLCRKDHRSRSLCHPPFPKNPPTSCLSFLAIECSLLFTTVWRYPPAPVALKEQALKGLPAPSLRRRSIMPSPPTELWREFSRREDGTSQDSTKPENPRGGEGRSSGSPSGHWHVASAPSPTTSVFAHQFPRRAGSPGPCALSCSATL